jgi:hypothetical protein
MLRRLVRVSEVKRTKSFRKLVQSRIKSDKKFAEVLLREVGNMPTVAGSTKRRHGSPVLKRDFRGQKIRVFSTEFSTVDF